MLLGATTTAGGDGVAVGASDEPAPLTVPGVGEGVVGGGRNDCKPVSGSSFWPIGFYSELVSRRERERERERERLAQRAADVGRPRTDSM